MKRIIARSLVIIAACIAPGHGASGEELSTRVFPSEDEVRQALELDIITYEQYDRLMDIIQTGIAPTDWYLLNEIPNLLYVDSATHSAATALVDEQRDSFQRSPSALHGEWSLRVASELDEDSRSRYRSRVALSFGEHWSGSLRLHREYTGRERFVGRDIEYRSGEGLIRRLTLGTFSRRFGLGTVVGYPGKRLSYSSHVNAESFICPDYGGFNGIALEMATRRWTIEGMTTLIRNDQFRMETAALMAGRPVGRLRPAVMLATHRVTNRLTRSESNHWKGALHLDYRYRSGRIRGELTGQFGQHQDFAAVAEGQHKFLNAGLSFSGWMYGERFEALTTGSRSASISRQVTQAETGLCYSDRRAGQRGVMLKTIGSFSAKWLLTAAFERAGYSRDTSLTEILGGLECRYTPGLAFRADYQYKNRTKLDAAESADYSEHCLRAESRFETGGLNARAYIARTFSDRQADYWSLFCRATVRFRNGMEVRAWSDLGRMTGTGIHYWYGFVQQTQQLFENVYVSTKFMHRYNHDSSQQHISIIELELTAGI